MGTSHYDITRRKLGSHAVSPNAIHIFEGRLYKLMDRGSCGVCVCGVSYTGAAACKINDLETPSVLMLLLSNVLNIFKGNLKT